MTLATFCPSNLTNSEKITRSEVFGNGVRYLRTYWGMENNYSDG